MIARATRPILILTVFAVFFSSIPTRAFDLIGVSANPGSAEGRMWPILTRITISPFVMRLPADPPPRFLAGESDPQTSIYAKIAAGVSVALADENTAIIVKRIALRGIGLQQTWPRRPATVFEVPTDHIFEAGLRFRF